MQKGLPTTAWNGGVCQLIFRRSVFTLVTSNAGSVYTYVTSEVPDEATSLATIITSGAGGAVSTIVSAQRLRNFFETHVRLRCIHRHVLTFSLSLLQTSEVESIGTEVTSIGGSAATVGLNLSQSNSILPCSSFSLQVVTDNAGDILSTITSAAESLGTRVTSVGSSLVTEATNSAGNVVSTITSGAQGAASMASSDAGAAQAVAPVIAGGLLGAGIAVVAML